MQGQIRDYSDSKANAENDCKGWLFLHSNITDFIGYNLDL